MNSPMISRALFFFYVCIRIAVVSGSWAYPAISLAQTTSSSAGQQISPSARLSTTSLLSNGGGSGDDQAIPISAIIGGISLVSTCIITNIVLIGLTIARRRDESKIREQESKIREHERIIREAQSEAFTRITIANQALVAEYREVAAAAMAARNAAEERRRMAGRALRSIQSRSKASLDAFDLLVLTACDPSKEDEQVVGRATDALKTLSDFVSLFNENRINLDHEQNEKCRALRRLFVKLFLTIDLGQARRNRSESQNAAKEAFAEAANGYIGFDKYVEDFISSPIAIKVPEAHVALNGPAESSATHIVSVHELSNPGQPPKGRSNI